MPSVQSSSGDYCSRKSTQQQHIDSEGKNGTDKLIYKERGEGGEGERERDTERERGRETEREREMRREREGEKREITERARER